MITSADAIITFTQPTLFSSPYQLQQFGTDDIYDTDAINPVEGQMGVDGNLSFGYVNVPVMQNYTLMADSKAITEFFEALYAAQVANQTVYPVGGSILLTSLGKRYTMTNGGLRSYKPLADAKRVLQQQKFAILWQRVLPGPA